MGNPDNYQRILKSILCLLLLTAIFSCTKEDSKGDVVVDSKLLGKLYLEAKDTVIIDNQNLVLKTELYRDFFPGVQKKNTRLFASIYIVNSDSSVLTDKFEIKSLYLINKDQIWISAPKLKDDPYLPIWKVSGISTNGPEWETGIYIDVVLALQDLKTAKLNYLVAREQIILRLD